MKPSIETSWLGLIDYPKALILQQKNVQKVLSRERQEVIMGLEHPKVITLGKRGGLVHLKDTPVIQTNRGGLATGHEPGQLVIYPIINIKQRQLRVREWVSMIEEACIVFLQALGLQPHRGEHSGLWIEKNKIASIGLHIVQGVSMHGISMNINNTLSIFSNMEVCGSTDTTLTSLKKENIQMELQTAFTQIAEILIKKLQAKEGLL